MHRTHPLRIVQHNTKTFAHRGVAGGAFLGVRLGSLSLNTLSKRLGGGGGVAAATSASSASFSCAALGRGPCFCFFALPSPELPRAAPPRPPPPPTAPPCLCFWDFLLLPTPAGELSLR